jgi:hypothetical protein
VTVCEPRWVEKQVPCEPCPTPCVNPCEPVCDPCAEGSMGLFSKLRGKLMGFGGGFSKKTGDCGCR